MGKSKTIKVVDVEPEMNEGAIQSEINNHHEIIKDIGSIAEPIVDVKPKAKRQPKAKKVEPIIEPEVIVESTLNESVVELKIPEELIKQIKVQADKVKCPDCEKMVSSKSLKYSHKHTCISKKIQEHNDKKSPRKNIIGEKREELLNNEDVIDNKEEIVYEPVVVELPVKPIMKESARDIKNRVRQERLLNLFVTAV